MTGKTGIVLILMVMGWGCGSSSSTSTSVVKRYCYSLDLKNDSALIAEYKRIHTKEGIWPEIPQILWESGITALEICLFGQRMFMIIETPPDWDYDKGMAWLNDQKKNQEWQEYTWSFQKALPNAKPGEKWVPMERVFKLEANEAHETPETGYLEPMYNDKTHRFFLTLDLKDDPDLIREYRRYHSPEFHWKEIAKGIREVGILDMQIYLVGTRMFMIAETPEGFDWDTQMALLTTLDRQEEWDTLMSEFQQSLPGSKPGEKWKMMESVFDLNRDF